MQAADVIVVYWIFGLCNGRPILLLFLVLIGKASVLEWVCAIEGDILL